MHAVDGLQLLHAVARQLLLVSLDVVETDALHVVDGRCQTVGGHIVGRAGFKLERQALEGRPLPRHLVNHLATSLIGRQLL